MIHAFDNSVRVCLGRSVWFAVALSAFGTACDFNDDPGSGPAALYLSAQVDGAAWPQSPGGVGGSLDASGADPFVAIYGDDADTGERVTLRFPPLMVSEPGAPGMGDASVNGPEFAGVIEFLAAGGERWISTTGELTIHEIAINSKHEYSGEFAGSLQNEVTGTTMEVTEGDYVIQAGSY